MSEIFYDCRWSDSLDDQFIEDFIATENSVFKGNYTKELFLKKYVNNIYGRSVVEVVYIDKKPVAARGLWRNDILGRPSYQPGDTCVTEACRGKGIFSEMTKKSLEFLNKDDIIYNFPNQNSYPGYIKMGWKNIGVYGLVFFRNNKTYLKEHPIKMDGDYAKWWLEKQEGIFYFKKGREYYLARKIRRGWYRLIACVEKEVAQLFVKKFVGICLYRSERKTFYNKNLGQPLHVVSKNDVDKVPLWKMDVL